MSTYPCMDTGQQQEVMRGFNELLRSAEVKGGFLGGGDGHNSPGRDPHGSPAGAQRDACQERWVQGSPEERCSSGG